MGAQTRWVACYRNAGLAWYRFASDIFRDLGEQPFFRATSDNVPNGSPSKHNLTRLHITPLQRTSVAIYAMITSTPVCPTSRQRGGAAWISAGPCVLEAGELAALCCDCPVFIFLLFTPTRTRVFQVPSLPTAHDGWRCAESFDSDPLLVQGRNDLPSARYNAATRGRLAFPCLLTRRSPSLRSYPDWASLSWVFAYLLVFFLALLKSLSQRYSYTVRTRMHLHSSSITRAAGFTGWCYLVTL